MKKLYSYQEIAHRIERGQHFTFTSLLRVEVTAEKRLPHLDTIEATLTLWIGKSIIGELVHDYVTVKRLLDLFDITDQQELFELAESENP